MSRKSSGGTRVLSLIAFLAFYSCGPETGQDFTRLREENAGLKKQNAILQAQLSELRATSQQNAPSSRNTKEAAAPIPSDTPLPETAEPVQPSANAGFLTIEQARDLLRGKTMTEVKKHLGPPRDVVGKAWWWSKDQGRFKGVFDPRTETPQELWITFQDNDGPVKYFTIGGDMTRLVP